MRCPSLDKLTDYLRGFGVGTERAQMQEHLATGCPTCQQNQRWLLEVQQIASLDDSFEFPEAITAHIVSWLPAKVPAKPAARPLRTLIAQLLFDSFTPLPLAEARAAAVLDAPTDAAAGRQLLYHVEGYDVDLRLEKMAEADSYDLLGQVLSENLEPKAIAGLMVELAREAEPPLFTQTDADGMFRFAGLAHAPYDLKIVLPEGILEIPQVRA